jgi:hypothetical protein
MANGGKGSEQNDAAPNRELAGAVRRLVKIMSMDDNVYAPDDTSR